MMLESLYESFYIENDGGGAVGELPHNGHKLHSCAISTKYIETNFAMLTILENCYNVFLL